MRNVAHPESCTGSSQSLRVEQPLKMVPRPLPPFPPALLRGPGWHVRSAPSSLLGGWDFSSALPVETKSGAQATAQVESKVTCNTRCHFYTSGSISNILVSLCMRCWGLEPGPNVCQISALPTKKITLDISFVKIVQS